MKKIAAFILSVLMMFTLFGCEKETKKVNFEEFDALLNKLPVVITQTELLEQTGNVVDKQFYPDMLTATFQNRTKKVITFLQVAFVAWDKDGNPVNINSADGESYETKAVRYKNINLESGRYYGKDKGIELAPNHNIASFRVIVVSFKTKDGKRWNNPYYDAFMNAFAGKKYSEKVKFTVEENDEKIKTLTKKQLKKTVLNEEALAKKLDKLPVKILSAEYFVSGENKDATPDTLKATFKNTSRKKLSKVTLCFFAFDENGKAVKIKSAGDNGAIGNYTAIVEYDTPNFGKNDVFDNKLAYQVHEDCGIKYVIAVVKSYTDADGEVYENPYYVDCCLIYEGRELAIEKPEDETSEVSNNE